MSEPMFFAERLDLLLTKKKLKRTDLASALGIPPATIAMWKLRGNLPRKQTLARIANYLGVELKELLSFGEDEDSQRVFRLELEAEKILELARVSPALRGELAARLDREIQQHGRPTRGFPNVLDRALTRDLANEPKDLFLQMDEQASSYFKAWATENREFLNLCMNLNPIELADVIVEASRTFRRIKSQDSRRVIYDILPAPEPTDDLKK